jgi:hypothetical protein
MTETEDGRGAAPRLAGRARRAAGLPAADRLRQLVPVHRLAQQRAAAAVAFMNLVKQRYWTGFDVMVNIVGYMPLGVLLVLALYPLVRGVWAALLAAILGFLVSGTMEVGAELFAEPRALEPRPADQCGGCLAGAPARPAAGAPMLLDQGRLYRCASAGSRRMRARAWCCSPCGRWPRSIRRVTCSATARSCRSSRAGCPTGSRTDIDLIAMLRPGAGDERRAVLAVGDHHHRLRHDRRRPHPAVPAAPRRAALWR